MKIQSQLHEDDRVALVIGETNRDEKGQPSPQGPRLLLLLDPTILDSDELLGMLVQAVKALADSCGMTREEMMEALIGLYEAPDVVPLFYEAREEH